MQKFYRHWNANAEFANKDTFARMQQAMDWWNNSLTEEERNDLRVAVDLHSAGNITSYYTLCGAEYEHAKVTRADLTRVSPEMREGEALPAMLVTFTGPSCSGKTKLVQELIAGDSCIQYIRSLATRDPRSPDEDRIYRFVTEEQFLTMDRAAEVLQKVYFQGQWYGSHRQQLFEECAGKIAIAIVEPSGVQAYRDIATKFGLIYLPIYLDAWESDLETRWHERRQAQIAALGSVDEAYYAKRIGRIKEELNWKYAESYAVVLPPSTSHSFNQILASAKFVIHRTANARIPEGVDSPLPIPRERVVAPANPSYGTQVPITTLNLTDITYGIKD